MMQTLNDREAPAIISALTTHEVEFLDRVRNFVQNEVLRALMFLYVMRSEDAASIQ